jgi:transposase InsO family protein
MRNIGLDVELLCEVANVSRSGYYKYLKHADEPDKDYNDYMQINEIFERGKAKYGWRTIQMKLLQNGVVMNHKKISRIKKKYHLMTKIRRRNPYKMIMKKSLEHRTCENILNREFDVSIPFKIFSTDITYLPFNHRFAYLSVVKDVASGEVVAWNLSMHLEMSLVLNTMEAMKNNPVLPQATLQNAMIHSDQGFHYTNPLYIEKLKGLNMVQSMSRRGNCIDNAPIESFFGHLKDDVDYKACKIFDELYPRIAEYMQYYNHERPQWNRKKMTPVGYRNHLLTA